MTKTKRSDTFLQTTVAFLRRLFVFLGTMPLAITLLLTLAVASVIGTVLQQNLPYPDYLIKFGPFWFEVFKTLGLYDVYSAVWFLLILVLLVISTSVCVTRNLPSMVRDMWQLRTQVQRKSLQAMSHSRQWQAGGATDVAASVGQYFKQIGFRHKQVDKPETDEILISAMRGGLNRLGYLLTHIAIVVICLGGLMDSNVPLKWAEWRGDVVVETRDLSISQVPAASRISVNNQAFRGSISIPEGKSASVAFLGFQDGYVMQELPFKLAVKDFRIEHYATGQPKSFESDLVLTAPELDAPLEQTIAVNHPLSYKGYTIYQASFSDGGTDIKFDVYRLDNAVNAPESIMTKVFSNTVMSGEDETLKLEITNFRLFNINPDPTEDAPQQVRDFGPNVSFKLRTATGEAREYENYLYPIPRNGREYFLSGVRSNAAEEMRYLYVPADAEGSLDSFMQFLGALHQSDWVNEEAAAMVYEQFSASASDALQIKLTGALIALTQLFQQGGFAAVGDFIDKQLPDAERETLGETYLLMLREMLGRLFIRSLGDSSTAQNTSELSKENAFLLQDSVTAIGALPAYGSPLWFAPTDYTHVQASGLQIARTPGKPIVYLGCAMLIIGIFILFYLPQRRFWLLITTKAGSENSQLVLAGMSNRDPREFEGFFNTVAAELETGTLILNQGS